PRARAPRVLQGEAVPHPLHDARPVDVVVLVLRGLAVVSLLVTAVAWEPTDAALMLLVVGGVAVPAPLRVPAGLDALYCAALLVAGWSSVLGLYESVEGWDLTMHL